MIMRDLVGAGQRSGKGCCIHQAGPCTTPGVFIDYPDCSGHTALSPQADIYVSDGYQNARVHKYSPDGKLLFSWGEPGTDAGQFNLVHNIACDATVRQEAGPRTAIAAETGPAELNRDLRRTYGAAPRGAGIRVDKGPARPGANHGPHMPPAGG
jgi:hypothetical protein